MSSPRTYHGMAATPDHIYVVGGTSAVETQQCRVTSIERFSLEDNVWENVAKLVSDLLDIQLSPKCALIVP